MGNHWEWMGRNDTGRYIRSRGISLGFWESRAGLRQSIAVYHINIAVISLYLNFLCRGLVTLLIFLCYSVAQPCIMS